YYLGAFGTLWLPYNTQYKTGQTGAKVRAMKSRWNFCNEHTRSNPLDPKLMFWCVSYYLGAFGTVFCPTTPSAKRVNWCNCSCHKVTLEFFATDAPDPTHCTLTSRFGTFRTIWVHLRLFGCHTTLNAKRVKLVQKFVPRSLVGILATNTPDPPHWTLNSCFGVFCIIWVHLGLFGCVTTLTVKRVKLVKNFVPRSPIGFFRNERTR